MTALPTVRPPIWKWTFLPARARPEADKLAVSVTVPPLTPATALTARWVAVFLIRRQLGTHVCNAFRQCDVGRAQDDAFLHRFHQELLSIRRRSAVAPDKSDAPSPRVGTRVAGVTITTHSTAQAFAT